MADPEPMNVYPAPDGCNRPTSAPESSLSTKAESSAASGGTPPSPALPAESS
jgi:hypothetical protein